VCYVRDAESSFLELGLAAGEPIEYLLDHSVTYRVAMGRRAVQKVFSLQTVSAPWWIENTERRDLAGCGIAAKTGPVTRLSSDDGRAKPSPARTQRRYGIASAR
jgi:hypothetical protein